MKKIVIPADIEAVDFMTGKTTGEKVTFNYWLQSTILRDPRCSEDWKAQRSAVALDAALGRKDAGTVCYLENTDYDLLKSIVEAPRYLARTPQGGVQTLPGYPPEFINLARVVLPFVLAVQGASDEAPLPSTPPANT